MRGGVDQAEVRRLIVVGTRFFDKDDDLVKALHRGIGVHHSGMPLKYRQIVEILFRCGYLPVVIATGKHSNTYVNTLCQLCCLPEIMQHGFMLHDVAWQDAWSNQPVLPEHLLMLPVQIASLICHLFLVCFTSTCKVDTTDPEQSVGCWHQ